MSVIEKNAFEKSLKRLEDMAKGQLFHTGSDSAPGSWAGTTSDDQDENTDGIDENGTDYAGVKKSLAGKVAKGQKLTDAELAITKGQNPLKLIADKIVKGETLTSAENWAVKGGMAMFGAGAQGVAKGDPTAASVPEMNAGAAVDEVEGDAKKSLEQVAAKSETLAKGLEISPFLYEFTRAMGEALRGTEARVAKSVADVVAPIFARVDVLEKALGTYTGEQGEFNKSLAEAVIGLGQQALASTEAAVQAASAPARAPKSQLRSVQTVQKSFGPGGLDTSIENMNKSQITDAMCELVQKGQLSGLEVTKYEISGEMSPVTQQRLSAHLASVAR